LARSNRSESGGAWSRWKARVKQLKLETWAVYLAYRDPRTPWYARVFALCVVGYALSPIDLVPDFIPVLGYLDDLILVPLGLALAIKMIPQPVLDECREQARHDESQGKLGWRAGAVVVLTWFLLAVLAALLIRRLVRG
jgi:uncharacterized membrane protein YkvA (DUF1232 family)